MSNQIKDYHAHIYFDLGYHFKLAEEVKDGLEQQGIKTGRMHRGLIGPHTKPMFAVELEPEQFAIVVPWLMLNRKNLDVLVHPNTGDELKDHTEYCLWLGDKVPLDLSRL